jgi:uncharacterized membrane protein
MLSASVFFWTGAAGAIWLAVLIVMVAMCRAAALADAAQADVVARGPVEDGRFLARSERAA